MGTNMGMAIPAADNDHRAMTGEAQTFEKLKELARSGYVPDGAADGKGGLLLRHPSGPDLILQPDGTIDLPTVQSPKRPVLVASPSPRMSKLRTLAIVVMAALFWFFSVAVTVTILEGM